MSFFRGPDRFAEAEQTAETELSSLFSQNPGATA